jgi:FkbM family methyltransferase
MERLPTMDRVRQVIRDHRRARPFRLMAAASEKYLRAWYNDAHFVFVENGEHFALERFARWIGGRPAVVWDVGAHDGEWADEVHVLIPSAQVRSFEILPPLADRLEAGRPATNWWSLEKVGLSNRVGEVELTWNKDHDTTNAIEPRLGNEWFADSELTHITCSVTTIDALVAAGKTAPDLLKVDVEGHEAAVIEGGIELLSQAGAPTMIQFEYGDTWLPARRTLGDVQGLLEARGYSVGRLYPDHVAFKAYEYADDHFRMGNMIAVRNERLKALLQG